MTTYRLGLLGDPVSHSRSPAIHIAMLELARLDGTYVAIRADGEVFRRTIDELRVGKWDGLNVTMPHKGLAFSLADSVSPQARKSGSVNTLSRTEAGVFGQSTDSTAIADLLRDHRFADLTTVLVLGSGGSAAAALAAMDPSSKHVYVSARSPEKAGQLTSRLGGDVVAWGSAVAGALVVNATPIGMNGERLPDAVIDVAGGVIDLPYGPEPTPAIAVAGASGLPHADGHEFLIRQAMASFQVWTGAKTDYATLVDRLRNT